MQRIYGTNFLTTIFTLELRDVIALFSRDSLSLRATGVAIVVSISTALAAAFSNDSDMVVGWIPVEDKDSKDNNKSLHLYTKINQSIKTFFTLNGKLLLLVVSLLKCDN